MSCCGNKSVPVMRQHTAESMGTADPANSQTQRPPVTEEVYFQYTGKTALTVQGMFSRRSYRFNAPLAVVAVDGRDAPSVTAVPLLKRVRAPE